MKKSIRNILLFIILIVITCIIIPNVNSYRWNFKIYLNFFIIGLISIVMLIREVKVNSVSLNMIHWVFNLFFFSIAPTIQLISDYKIWGITHTEEEIINSQMLIVSWIIFYIFGNVIQCMFANNVKKNNKVIIIFKNKIKGLEIMTAISLICAIYLIGQVGFTKLFSRGTYSFDLGEGQSINLLIVNIIRAIIVFTAGISIVNYKINKTKKINLLINLLLLLITCFPSGLARNTAGTIYIGIFILLHYNKMDKFKNSYKFIIIFLLTIIVIFPMLSAFRRTDFLKVNISDTFSNVTNNLSDNYNSGDYDAFTMIGQTEEYVRVNGPTHGKQLIGSLLFFVPRKIWPNKPVGSGFTIFSSLGKQFKNVSCPIVAEGYINFGYIGLVLFAMIFGYYCRKLDIDYWKNVLSDNIAGGYITLIYPFLIGNYFFMLRGDLMSSYAYTMAYVVVFYILTKILYVLNKNNN